MVYVQHVFKVHPEQVFLRYFWLFLWLHSGLEICKVIRLILPKICKFNTHNQAIFLYKSMLYVLFRVGYCKVNDGNILCCCCFILGQHWQFFCVIDKKLKF